MLFNTKVAIFIPILIYFISKRIRNFGKVTVPDIFEARYGQTAAILATITTVIAYTTIVSYQFRGGGKVLSMVSDGMVTMESGIIITAVFAISYTAIAGMFSVVYTDVVNGVLMTIGTIGALIFLFFKVGGIGEIIAVAESAGKWQWFGNWAAESFPISLPAAKTLPRDAVSAPKINLSKVVLPAPECPVT